MFQSLLGRLKTGLKRPVLFGYISFQSLLGRLKTLRWQGGFCTSTKPFQSLLGRLKTRVPDGLPGVRLGFQSLLGRLKTRFLAQMPLAPLSRFNPC